MNAATPQRAPEIRKRLWLLIVAGVVSGCVAGVLAVEVDSDYALLFFTVPMVFGLATIAVRCPRCGVPAIWRGRYWGGFTPPRACAKCGLSFTPKD
jgi:predicted RNA-binding Zn-ribbon protein involved in translation (DUF1610 family)